MVFNVSCKVPECDIGDNSRDIAYDQPWVRSAIPSFSNGKLKNCVRYAPIKRNETDLFAKNQQCTTELLFNTSAEIECTEFIYATDERNVQTEVFYFHFNYYQMIIIRNG